MFNLTMLAVLILASVFIKSTLTDRSYCLINTEHTMCKYKATSPNCVLYSTQDQVETAQMLNDHNAARNAYAAGSQGFLIPNMLKMYWDQELADISSMWACQCESTKDKNRDVPRFRVGQIVWSEVRQKQFTTWEKLWKKILHSSGGFYIRDIVGNLRIQFNSHHPLSYIYNPSVNFVGCTLAKHRIWSLSFGELVYSTTLVCNYGPIKEYYSSEQTYEEDWPCRACPLHKPCFTEHFWVKTLTSNKLVLERNLCVDAELESSIILPGKGCPSSLRSQNLFLTEGRQFSGDGSSASNDDLSLNVLDINDENLKDVMDNITNLETESIGDVMQLNPGMLDVNGKVDYCSLTCDNAVNHTMCVYQNESPQCSGFLSLMNTAVKDDLVKLHNDFRNDFARGEIPRAYPLASNMMLMEWKEELQVTAHRWISQCNLSHDSCRDHLFHDPRLTGKLKMFKVGQNIGWRTYDTRSSMFPSYRDIFQDWVDEIHNFSATSITGYVQYVPRTEAFVDNFVQLIWAETFYVGCGYAVFKKSNTTSYVFLVCNYAPAGILEGLPIYMPGGPCTSCESNTGFRRSICGKKYPNLCVASISEHTGLQPASIVLLGATSLLHFCHLWSKNRLYEVL